MKEKDLKKQSKILMILFGFVGVFMVTTLIVTNFTAKGTYSVDTDTTCTCPSGGNYNSTASACVKQCYQEKSSCESGGWSCQERTSLQDGTWYYCTKAATCTDPFDCSNYNEYSTSTNCQAVTHTTCQTVNHNSLLTCYKASSTCVSGYHKDKDKGTCVYGTTCTLNGLSGTYNSNGDCIPNCVLNATYNSSSGKCECNSGYEEFGTACVKKESTGKVASSAGCYKCSNSYIYYEANEELGPACDTTPNSSYIKVPGSNSNTCQLKTEVEKEKTVTLTFKSNTGATLATRSCTIPANQYKCTSDLVAPSGSIPTISGKKFNGWGNATGCTGGGYMANATFTITRDSSDKSYYACYTDDNSGDTSKDFSTSKCGYSALATVTRDERYLNCKYVNIWYNNDPNNTTGDSAANIQACCHAKGYTWISSNFTSSGFGNEYCIVCSGSGGGGGGSDTPTPTTPTDNYACYLVNHKYVWASSKPSGGTLVSSKTTEASCTGCESGYSMDSSNNCIKPGTSTTPSSPSNVPTNPQTGTIAIIFAWVIGLVAIVYSFWYFKKSSSINK